MISDYHKKMDYSRFKVSGYPVRHREKIPFMPQPTMSYQFKEYVRQIQDLDRKLGSFILSADDYMNLVNEAYASNIHWSTMIEGNKLSLDEVLTLTTRFTKNGLRESKNGPVQEILNHLESMFGKDRFMLPWTSDTVCSVHQLLMNGVGQTVPGKIRTVEVSVGDTKGIEYFIACPAANVLKELDSLMDWLSNSPYDDIITSTLFFHEFESIHPFDDGNGRTGRTLFQMHLQECGLRNCNLCKFETELLSDREAYYDLLAYTDATANYTPLVQYFIESLLIAYQKAVDEFESKDRLKDFDENTRHIAMKAREFGRFTLSDASSWINLGEQMVRRKLGDLVDVGILRKDGRTRGLHYVFNDPFSDLRMTLDFGNPDDLLEPRTS